ncbi:glycosyltransferase [Desulfonatronum thioautotrophicum]|uniref:glycosyltransferase n=1 Tax=Desulfonatronum thioautotrophicum TaxID=617001 RepID=UPI000699FC38|nr:glycosyltransferase [Desulfonatronum thioautotrophicum]
MPHDITTILRQHRSFGYPDPTWFIWAANQIFQGLSRIPEKGQPSLEQQAGLPIAMGMLRQAAIFSPYDRNLFALLFQLHAVQPESTSLTSWHRWADGQVRDLGLCPHPQAVTAVESLGGELDGMLDRLQQVPPVPEYFLLLQELWRLGETNPLLEHIQRFMHLPGAAPACPVLALAAWRAGAIDLARHLRNQSPPCFLIHLMEAELAWDRGDVDTAEKYWLDSLNLEPLQPTLILKLSSARRPPPSPALTQEARVHVAFYTFNKLNITLETLQSLLESNIGNAGITLLNNGSTQFSPEELAAGVDAVRQGRPVDLLHLPTNIGAPAARNWLRTLPQTCQADYLAYLDDDVLLPRDWLARYLQDLEEWPEVVCVGPQCLNPGTPSTIQYIWRNFERFGDHSVRFTNNCPQFMDFGQYNAPRPCLSVMGCCHLFDMRKITALNVPDFDIRFTPTQVDDLEHDMQIWKAGGQVLFNGQVRVIHRQDTGRRSQLSRAALGNIHGNHRKMEAKWSGEDLKAVDLAVRKADDAWYRKGFEHVRNLFPQEVGTIPRSYCLQGQSR